MLKLFIVIVAACAFVYFAYLNFDEAFGTTHNTSPDKTYTACTAEAKLCPDGSAVGRVGANCEFAACPSQ